MVNQKVALAVVVLLSGLVVYGSSLGNRPFFTRGEAREALVVSAMVSQQELVLPRRNGLYIPSKPPFFHWVALGSSKILGRTQPSEFEIRFPSALCAAFALFIFFVFAAEQFSLSSSLLMALVLGTSVEWLRSSGNARVDMVFAFWLTFCFICAYKSLMLLPEKGKRAIVWTAFSVFGVAGAVLSKGPAGAGIPAAAAFVFFLLHYRKKINSVYCSFLIRGSVALLLGASIASVWYVLAYLEGGREFIDVQLIHENIARLLQVSERSMGHDKPFFYVPLFLLATSLPWSVFLPFSVAKLWVSRKRLPPVVSYSLIWVAVMLVVVMLSSSKRMVYLLPSLPACSIFIVYPLLDECSNDPVSRWASRIPSVFCWLSSAAVFLFLVGAFVLSYVSFPDFPLRERDLINVQAVLKRVSESLGYLLLLLNASLMSGAAAVFINKRAFRLGIVLLSSGILSLFIFVNVLVYPAIAEVGTAKSFMKEVRQQLPQDSRLYQYYDEHYAPVYYFGKPIPHITSATELGGGPNCYVLVSGQQAERFLGVFSEAKEVLRSSNLADSGRAHLLIFQAVKP